MLTVVRWGIIVVVLGGLGWILKTRITRISRIESA
jgi:hypothetical protein